MKMESILKVKAEWIKVTIGRKVFAGQGQQYWVTDSTSSFWRQIPESAKVEPLGDCPWYAEPSEATRRANGEKLSRYIHEQ